MGADRTLNVCLIGCGHMGRLHAGSLAGDKHLRHLTVCDADPNVAQMLADNLASPSLEVVVAPIETALRQKHFDAYVIASPAHLHLEQCAIAAESGAYVFCEKPVAPEYEDILEQLDRLSPYEDRIQVGFNRRFDPQMAALKSGIERGAIGEIEQLHIVSRDHTPPTLEQLETSAGLIAETAIHDFDMVRWLLGGEVRSIACYGAALVNSDYAALGHIDTATMVMIGENGQQVVLQNSWRAANGYDQRIEAFGPKGRLNVGNPLSDLVVFEDRGGARHGQISDDWSTRYRQAYSIEIASFLECVARKGKTSPSLSDGIAASKLAHFAQLSLQQGQAIQLQA
ncbi:MAG: Gfo/Idh/MocA family oxidoreductase [Pseudomonadota bacterium]